MYKSLMKTASIGRYPKNLRIFLFYRIGIIMLKTILNILFEKVICLTHKANWKITIRYK